nr:MAG TPA: hypothetical protein [Caudoviricetes sp.]
MIRKTDASLHSDYTSIKKASQNQPLQQTSSPIRYIQSPPYRKQQTERKRKILY